MKRMTQLQKQEKNGGSFYAIALGIGILVSTVSSLVCNIVTAAKAGNSTTSSELYAMQRRSTMMRLSPVPSRSSVTVF